MSTKFLRLAAVGVAIFAASSSIAMAQQSASAAASHPGKVIYEKYCATCHDNPEATKSPSLDTLRRMRLQQISYALTQGKMQTQAAGISAEQRAVLMDFLVGRQSIDESWIAKMQCPANRGKLDTRASAATVTTFGFDKNNHRHLSKAQSGLATSDFANLELAWAMAFPATTTMRAQPAIVGNMMFLPVADNARLYAIDIAGSPCVKWSYQSEVPLRTSAGYGELPAARGKPARKVLVFADLGAHVHMIDAQTGEGIWREHVGLSELTLTTGTPVLHKDRVYAPISQYEIILGGQNAHLCCKSHGAVTALDAASGKEIWTAHTMEEAKPVRDRGDGQMIWGPSGAPIWNSPAIDEKRGLLYVGTGEATSEPAHKNTDSMLAIDLKDGSIRWSFQATANDIFLSGCGRGSKNLNCPTESVFRDVDFGASMILASSQGKDVVIGGQKSGEVWALDRDTGKLVWNQPFGTGSPLGGIHWGIAFDGKRVFAPINRPYGAPPEGEATQKPGMHAIDVDTGKVLWSFVAEPDCTGDRQARVRSCATNIGLSAAPVVIDGAVVAGALDGYVRAFDAKTGEGLFKFDTAREFETINGVKGGGGAIDAASIAAANGYLFVNSGYGMFGQLPGNVLLAFKPKK